MNPTTPGTRIELVATGDMFTELKPGDRGTVTYKDAAGTVFIAWDGGSRLGLVPDEDTWKEVGQ